MEIKKINYLNTNSITGIKRKIDILLKYITFDQNSKIVLNFYPYYEADCININIENFYYRQKFEGDIIIYESKYMFQRMYPDVDGKVKKIANLIDDIFFETIETDKEDVICFVGRLEFGKGSIMIDKIVRNLKHKYNFIVAGEIINFDTKIVDEYYNNAAPEIIKQIYAKSKYLIYPSLYDTFALVIPEAISQRCIPVISPLPSLSVHKGVKRAKIDRLEEYLKLIEDESNNENLIKEGLEYIQQFHPRKFLEILKEGVEEFENYQIL